MLGLILILVEYAMCQNQNTQFSVGGINSNFSVIAGSVTTCNSSISCYERVCETLDKNRVTFAFLNPLYKENYLLPIYAPIDMIVAGINLQYSIIKNSSTVCYTFTRCMELGLKLWNKYPKMQWIVMTGKCNNLVSL